MLKGSREDDPTALQLSQGNEMTPQQVIINYLVEEGLDPSYMEYHEIAEAVVIALKASGHLEAD